jgi:hypothetical protein
MPDDLGSTSRGDSGPPWHTFEPDEALRRLDTTLDRGLAEDEAAARLALYASRPA